MPSEKPVSMARDCLSYKDSVEMRLDFASRDIERYLGGCEVDGSGVREFHAAVWISMKRNPGIVGQGIS